MKQKNNLDIEFGAVKLYFEDFLQIESFAKELSNFEKISISVQDCEYESFSEIKSLHEELNELRVIVHQKSYKSFTISFSNFRNTISDYNPDLETKGVIYQIAAFFKKNEKSFSINLKKFCKYFYWVGIICMGLMGLLNDLNKILAFVYLGVFLVSSIGGIYWLFPLKSNLIFLNKKDRKSFWGNNKDQLIVGLISSFFSAIIGGLFGFFLAKGL